MTPPQAGRRFLCRAGVFAPQNPCQPAEFTSAGCFSLGPPRNVFRGADGDIVLFRFNVIWNAVLLATPASAGELQSA